MSSEGDPPSGEMIPALDDVLEIPHDEIESGTGDEQWIVLYPEDFDNLMIDEPGNLALKVSLPQAIELFRLSHQAICELDPDGDMKSWSELREEVSNAE